MTASHRARRKRRASKSALDAAEFRRALAQFAAGVTVVTTRDADGEPEGLTVTAFCSLSLRPPLVLVCLDQRAAAAAHVRDSGVFGVSVLAEGQEDVSRAFAVSGPAKFSQAEMEPGACGVAFVRGCVAQLECRLRATLPGGDHIIYVGEVEHVKVRPGRPLVYHDRAYRALARPEPNGLRGGATLRDQVYKGRDDQ